MITFQPNLQNNRKLFILSYNIALVLLMSVTVNAQDMWPQFLGPHSNPVGTHAKLADRWSKTENVEWSLEIPGRGYSSPIVTDGKVYVTTVTTEGKSKVPQTGTEYSNEYAAELEKQGLSIQEIMKRLNERDIELPNEVKLHYILYSLNLKSGKVEWTKEFFTGQPPGGRHRKNSFASETPVTDGKFIYVYVANLGLWAFDLKGNQAWHTPLENNPIYLDLGAGSSPALAGNLLVILSDNQKQQYIAAYDKQTGKQVWRTNRDLGGNKEPVQRSGWSTPFVWKHPQRTEIVTVGVVAHVGGVSDTSADAFRLRRFALSQRRPRPSLVRDSSRRDWRHFAEGRSNVKRIYRLVAGAWRDVPAVVRRLSGRHLHVD
jgi:hypothetical protein